LNEVGFIESRNIMIEYRIEGEKFITNVDVAWNPAWVGTEQVRFWRLQDGKLHITSAPIPNPNKPGNTMIGTLIWERE
jgi:Lipocalin-like domain